MARLPVSTRWRELANPVSPYDPIQADAPHYEEGKLPSGFLILCWDGNTLMGPYRFDAQGAADLFIKRHPKITHFLVIPNPDDTYEPTPVPGLS